MKNEFLICLIILSSCQGKTNNTKVKTTSQVDSFRNSLIGKWGGLKESNPVWKITHDSIYYYGQDKSYAYEVEGNDLVWEFDSSQARLKNVSVIGDTLFFYLVASIDGKTYQLNRGFRFK